MRLYNVLRKSFNQRLIGSWKTELINVMEYRHSFLSKLVFIRMCEHR